MNIDISNREFEFITTALKESAEQLTQYMKWIDDRPMLPNVEIAINRMIAEKREIYKLITHLYEELRTQTSE